MVDRVVDSDGSAHVDLELAGRIVDGVRVPLLVLDRSLRVLAANHAYCRAFETTPEALHGRALEEIGGGRWASPTLRALLEDVLAHGDRLEDFELQQDGGASGPRILVLNGSLLDRVGNQPTALLLAIEDVTEQRLAAQERERQRAELERLNGRLEAAIRDLERSNHELEQFAYVASHDLQEPLRMVTAYTELLARRYEGQLDAKADKYIAYAVDGAKRMQVLINDLLALSRVGTRGKPLAPVDAADAVGDALRALRAAIRDAEATVSVGELPRVMADRGQLAQVFQNLIANAIKFRGDAAPVVRISAAPQGDRWVFQVADNGIGIAPAYHDRIFTVFQRLHGRGDYPGNGMGLSIVKKIVERHGGRVWVESEVGAGARFSFTLKAANPE